MWSTSEVQEHLKDCLFHGLCRQLHNSMHYLYDDMRAMCPQLVTAAYKTESEQKDLPGEGV